MKKFFFSAAVLVASVFSLSAAHFEPGVRVGLNVSNIDDDQWGEVVESDAKAGLNVGFDGDLVFDNNMFINTGLLFDMKGAKFPVFDDWEHHVFDYKETDFYLTVPVHFGYKFKFTPSAGMFIDFGPYFSYALGGKEKSPEGEYDVFGDEGYRRRFDMGLGLRLGPEFADRFSIAMAFDWGLFNTINDDNKYQYDYYYSSERTVRNFNFSVNFGVKF